MSQKPANLDLPLTTPSSIDDLDALKRALVKLSFIGSGIHKRLDQALEQLRTQIKKSADTATIQQHVDTITNLLRELDDDVTRKQQLAQGVTVRELMQEFLRADLPPAVVAELKQIKQDESDSSRLAGSIAHAFLNWPTQEKAGFWTRWFGNRKESSTDQPSTTQQSDSSLNAVVAITPDIMTPLMRLMDNLNVPDSSDDVLRHLRHRATQLKDVRELTSLLEELSALVLDANSEEQAQFEAFIKQISERLATVEAFLLAQGERDQANASDSDRLNSDVRQQVRDMQQNVKQAIDLQQLQSSLENQLDSIVGSVEKFRGAQQKRQQTSEGEIKRLREQLRASEGEAEQLRNALREQRIRATTDALTQLPNRHAYHDRLHQEYSRWRRYRGKLSLVLCDVDLFKQVNDKHGHSGGDVVLKHIANVIRTTLRESDFAARFGGEEFVLLMPETNLVDATKAVNKLRQRIASQSVTYEHQNIAVTASFGVAEFEGEDVPRDVFERADKALYRAKVKGRNQVNCERKLDDNEESSVHDANASP